MKIAKEIKTPMGDITIYEDENGNLTNSKPVNEETTYKQFLVSSDPSQYALGTGIDSFEKAVQYHSLKEQAGEEAYIIELHYQDEKSDTPPLAVFVYDSNLKRIRII